MTDIPIKNYYDSVKFSLRCPACKQVKKRTVGWLKQQQNASFQCIFCNRQLRMDAAAALQEFGQHMQNVVRAFKNKLSIPIGHFNQVIRVRLAEENGYGDSSGTSTEKYTIDYGLYDRVLALTHERMIKDGMAQSESIKGLVNKASNTMTSPMQAESLGGKMLRTAALPLTVPAALLARIPTDITTLIEGGSDAFDLKPQIRPLAIEYVMPYKVHTLRAGSPVPLAPIRGDSEYLYYYDIWGNIYFGYITAAAHHWATELWVGNAENNIQNAISGIAAGDDQLSVELGYKLYEKYGLALTKEQMGSEIYDFRLQWSTEAIRFKPEELGLKNH